ncbi:phage major capsid protein [Lutibacter aestuarii]|uniref:Phage major capsid protein n=1 Tax=Lutibacter aestuarii TaxID=861111 RepID=A0ABW2Z8J0_9FLAO
MKTSKQLKEQRASLVTEQQGFVTLAKSEKREFTPEEETRFDAIQEELKTLDAQIKRAEAAEALELRLAATNGETVGESEQKEKRKMLKDYSLHRALRSQLQGGKLEGVEAEYDQEMRAAAKAAGVAIQGVAIPNGAEKRDTAQTVTQDAGAYGANLVGTQTMGIIDQLRPKPILEQMGATYLRGLTGKVEFPTNDGGIVATWEGERDTVAPTKNAYGKISMDPKRLSATVQVSLQNLIQSTPNLEAMTASDIRLATQLAIDIAGINGSGVGNVPLGILNAPGTFAVVGGTDGAAPTWANVVGMETGIYNVNAEAANMGYLINPVTKGKLKTTKHEAGDLGYLMTPANEINGYKVGVSTLVPSDLDKGTSVGVCSAAIFGNFADLLIGEWGFYDMVVDNITGKKAGIIEITVNQFIDILVKRAKSFAVVKDWLTA